MRLLQSWHLSRVVRQAFLVDMPKLRTHEHCQSRIDMIGYVLPVATVRMLKMTLYSPEALSRLNNADRLIDWLPFSPHVQFFGHKCLRSPRE